MVEMLNPIYDASFKFLMSDEKVAKILISTLLKRNVTQISFASQEYANTVADRKTNSDYTIYRLDFKATITDEEVDGDGNVVERREETVLIELQKVWLQTELLRFRKYIAGQYADPANVQSDGKTPRHIIAIYLLGHKLPLIETPIAYGYGNNLVDYGGKPIEMSGKSKFVDSLTHDIIIVQIPRLPEKPGNAAERLLDVFDQRFSLSSDRRVISLPEDLAHDSEDKKVLVAKLREGLLDPEMRQQLSVEEEILWELDSRDMRAEFYKKKAEENRIQAEENKKKADEANESLRKAAKSLKAAGQSDEVIAGLLSVDVERIKEWTA